MITKFISDKDIQKAAVMVQCSMLESLPEKPDGQFSDELLERIDELRVVKKRFEKRWKYRKRLATVAAALFIAMTILLSLNTEVRAAVTTWFKEVFASCTIY